MADINVTPLVDVMLVLLIIFMVTAPLLTAGVPVNLPDSSAKPLDQDQKPVQISIDEQGRIFVDKDEVTDAILPDILQQVVSKAGKGAAAAGLPARRQEARLRPCDAGDGRAQSCRAQPRRAGDHRPGREVT